MNDFDDLNWLRARHPDVTGPTAETTAQRRWELLANTVTTKRRRPRTSRILAVGAAAAAVAVVTIAVGGDGGSAGVLATPTAKAAPLVRLAAHVRSLPEPAGDATLLLKRHVIPQGHSFTGASLFLDDGREYWAPTREELHDLRAKDSSGTPIAAILRAATSSSGMPPAEARQRLLEASPPPPAQQSPPAVSSKMSASEAKQLGYKRDEAGDWVKSPPRSRRSVEDNYVWMNAMTALEAGAGNADVRAGVLRALAAMSTVVVGEGAGILSVRATDFPDGYQETLFLDAATGVVKRFEGGTAGRSPDVTVTYETERVSAADVLG